MAWCAWHGMVCNTWYAWSGVAEQKIWYISRGNQFGDRTKNRPAEHNTLAQMFFDDYGSNICFSNKCSAKIGANHIGFQISYLWPTTSHLLSFMYRLLAIPCHTMLCHTMSYNTMLYHAMPCHTMPYRAMACHTMAYHTITSHGMPYHGIPYHTMPYHLVILWTHIGFFYPRSRWRTAAIWEWPISMVYV